MKWNTWLQWLIVMRVEKGHSSACWIYCGKIFVSRCNFEFINGVNGQKNSILIVVTRTIQRETLSSHERSIAQRILILLVWKWNHGKLFRIATGRRHAKANSNGRANKDKIKTVGFLKFRELLVRCFRGWYLSGDYVLWKGASGYLRFQKVSSARKGRNYPPTLSFW